MSFFIPALKRRGFQTKELYMKISQSISSVVLLLLAAVALSPTASAASAPVLARPSVSSPSAQLISQAGMMSLGGSGSLVSQLQEDLASLGYFSGTNTGYFGSATEDAVMRFQQDAGLTVDGQVGSGTSEAIRQRIGTGGSSAPVSETLLLNDSGAQVSELQKRLINLGYFDGPATGFFGSQTQAAVINFQQANGIAADGVVGRGTAEALRQAQ
jgi:peptidoglycan hydrolase-like protein with peptidoglycan-binding domain